MSAPVDLLAPLAHGEDCGCCAGITSETPLSIHNRPGLSAIVYRFGTHQTFKSSLLAALSGFDRGAVSRLTTRSNDDFSIALLDAWSVVADILTFYQERIANECTLRTATEKVSIVELAKLIGYHPRPGAAASTMIAFTVDEIPGGPEEMILEPGIKVQSIPGPDETPQTFETIEPMSARKAWNVMKPEVSQPYFPKQSDTHVYFAGLATGLKVGDALLFVSSLREADSTAAEWELARVKSVTGDLNLVITDVELDRALPALGNLEVKVYAMRVRAASFGHNAPDFRAMPDSVKTAYGSATGTEWPGLRIFEVGDASGILQLDQPYPQIVPATWLVMSKPGFKELYRVTAAVEDSRTGFAMSSKTMAVQIAGNNFLAFNFNLRNTTIFAAPEPLVLAQRPLLNAMPSGAIVLDREVPEMSAGRKLIVRGALFSDTAPIPTFLTELATVASTSVSILTSEIRRTVITLAAPLVQAYARKTVTIYGNAALSTHGETVEELLGNGDASIAHQTLPLRQGPLTHVASDDPSGVSPAIHLYANELLWEPVPTLYQAGKRARVYAIERDEEEKATLRFGDGEANGARLPSGNANVKATYRKGLGAGGNVRAEQLSILLSRPFGLTNAINPFAASGGQDPELLIDARDNAPLTVLTLERAVSLLDYQNFARAFAGVEKALATWTWFGEERGVFITLAGVDGAAVLPTSQTYTKLLAALKSSGAPTIALRLGSYRAATFTLSARLKVAEDRIEKDVLANADAALRAAFSFDRRVLGQAVTSSEVLEVLHAVPGVEGVFLSKLHRVSATPSLQNRLAAESPVAGEHDILPAELLTVDPAPFAELGGMS